MDKITPELHELIMDTCLDDSTKVIRYLDEQKSSQIKYNYISLIISVLALIFSAIAAIGTIVGLLS